MNETMTTDERQAPSPGERIAAAFSRDKAHLSDAEQRCLAGMIDGEIASRRQSTIGYYPERMYFPQE